MRLAILGSLFSTAVMARPDIKTVDSSVPSSTDVQYNCVFENQWTRDRHPKDYPSDAVHWTRQVLASHSSSYNMWREGSLASNAVQSMAEAGGTADILAELENWKIDYEVGYDKYMVNDPTMRFNNPLEMTVANRYVSVISKMAPSPDWFSGFYDFSAVNEDKETWYRQFTIETYPYDAGTEDGNTYANYNSATRPQQPISQFTVNNAPNGIYLNSDGNDILPVAKYTCTLNTYSSSKLDIETIDSYVPSSQSVRYNCVFENQWNEDRHPNDFPTDNQRAVHWTKQILASHDSSYHMWKEGVLANKGVKNLAEAGGIATILKELQDGGNSYDIGYGKYLYALDPKVTYEPLKMTSNKRYVSAISKLVPSPDWFSGFHDFNAVNEKSDTWYQEFVIPIYPFDAGTEDGDTYNTVNSVTVPAQPISQFTVENLPGNKVFLNSKGDAILPVATYTCVLFDEDRDMVPTQSPIFATLTRSPTRAQQSSKMSQGGQQTNKNGLIIGLTVGALSAAFLSGILAYMLLCHKSRSSKTLAEEACTTTPSSEIEKGNKEIHEREIA